MKRMEVTEKRIGEYVFYITPFPAFTAANISGDLAALLAPVLGALAPLVGGTTKSGESGPKAPEAEDEGDGGILDASVEDALPVVAQAFSSLSGAQFERLMKKLLINSSNISVSGEATGGEVVRMDEDLANEVFCCDIWGMYQLCWEVIKLNFGGFFGRFGTRSGAPQESILKAMRKYGVGATSTMGASAT